MFNLSLNYWNCFPPDEHASGIRLVRGRKLKFIWKKLMNRNVNQVEYIPKVIFAENEN